VVGLLEGTEQSHRVVGCSRRNSVTGGTATVENGVGGYDGWWLALVMVVITVVPEWGWATTRQLLPLLCIQLCVREKE